MDRKGVVEIRKGSNWEEGQHRWRIGADCSGGSKTGEAARRLKIEDDAAVGWFLCGMGWGMGWVPGVVL